jgi:putative sigma-54 modulation protein
MHLATTFRHMDVSQAVKSYAEERLEKIRKYFQGDPISAHAIFAVERNHAHMAEFQITLPNGIVIQARETTEDMYSSIDLAGARIERQVRKWKDKIRDHKPHGGPSFSIRQRVIEAGALEPRPGRVAVQRPQRVQRAQPGQRDQRTSAGRTRVAGRTARAAGQAVRAPLVPPRAPAIKVIKEQTFTVRSMRVEDAVMHMNLVENEFFIFLDVDTEAVSVVYRRKDGNYGLIETGGRLPV